MTAVVTALGHRWETSVAASLEPIAGVSVVRRCADVAELVSVTAAGLGDCAVISADLRELDLGVIAALHARDVWVLGLHPVGDDEGERRLRQLSVDVVLPMDASAAALEAAVRDRQAAATIPEVGLAGSDDVPDPGGWRPAGDPLAGARGSDADPADGKPYLDVPRQGRLLAVWGPAGAPGRTTVAVTVAAEIASRGRSVLLVDADTYSGCIAQVLGLLDEAPGIAAACRGAEHGEFDLVALARVAPEVMPHLRVLTGLPRADRWPEVRAAALERVLTVSRSLADYVIIDCGFCLEEDEELSYDTQAPRRNEATLTSLSLSDEVLVVGGADPVALQRFVRGLQELGTVPSGVVRPVINRVRASAVGSDPKKRISASLHRFAGIEQVHFVPDDPAAVDAAVLAGRSVVEHAPDSAFRGSVGALVSAIAPDTVRRSAHRPAWRSRGRVRAVAG